MSSSPASESSEKKQTEVSADVLQLWGCFGFFYLKVRSVLGHRTISPCPESCRKQEDVLQSS